MKYMVIIILTIVIYADSDLKKIKSAYIHKDYKKVIKLLKNRANRGDLNAQLDLAKIYLNGDGVKKSPQKAIFWFQKASNKSVVAIRKLAILYLKGIGVKQDFKKAEMLFKKGAKKGDIESIYNLAVMYEKGIGVKSNLKEAIKLYKKAAQKGYMDAQYNLATIYYKDNNLTKAIYWYKKAALQGDSESLYNMGWFYANGKGVLKNKIKAYQYWIEAAKRSHQKAQDELDKLCKISPWACK